MSTIQDLADLFLRIANGLDAGKEDGQDDLMLAMDADSWRAMARIINDELEPEPEDLSPDTVIN